MSDPGRLRNVGTDEMRVLLRHATRPRPMTGDEIRRVEGRVVQLAGVGVGASLLLWVKGIVLGACLGGVVVTGHVLVERMRESETPPAPSSPSGTHGGRLALPPASPLDVPDASTQPDAAPPPNLVLDTSATQTAISAETDNSDDLKAELALLHRAQRSLASNPEQALALAEEHARTHPRGQLGMEREIVAIEALRRLGRVSQARTRAESLALRARGTLYEERVRNLVEESP